MMRSRSGPAALVGAAVTVLLTTTSLPASGPLGLYGIVERVVFEPNDRAPERIQVWGAFAYVDGGTGRALGTSQAKKGYLYFKLPALTPGFISQTQIDTVKTEWADLKAVAGTGQAVGFGSWVYVGGFNALQPDTRPGAGSAAILERGPQSSSATDLRIRPSAEAPASPATYQTNAGIVKLAEQGSHAAIVKALRDALR